MKLPFILFFLSSYAFAAANDTYINQRNSTNTNTAPITIPVPVSNALYYLDRANLTPKHATLGTGLQITGDVLGLTTPIPTATSQITNDSGYITSTSLAPYATITAVNAGLATKLTTPSCPTSQYLRGDASCANFPAINSLGSPNTRTLSLATAYQCTDTSRSCRVTLTVACPLTLSILAGSTCAGEVRIGSTNGVATGSGTNIAPIQRNASGILGLSTNDYETKSINIPVGWYFAVRQTSGTVNIVSAFDQAD